MLYAAPSAAQHVVEFSIPPQPLESALIELATQANVSISLPRQDLSRRASAGLVGAYTPDAALSRLLAASGFRHRRVGERAFRIETSPVRAEAAAPVEYEDIIVTAARRPTPLSDMPRSIAHLSSTDLENAGAAENGDLVRLTSGLSRTNLGEGRDKFILRGVSDGAITGRAQSLVGLYFGDTRLTYAAPDPDLRLFDVASVDILRGPQGALYGAGTLGGIVHIQPNPVDLDGISGAVFASVDATDSGGVGRDFGLALNIPIVTRRLGLRGAFYDQVSAGWLDNPTLGEEGTNSASHRGARLQALLAINSRWSLTGTAIVQDIDTADTQYLERTPSGLTRTTNLLEPHDNDFSLVGATLHGSTRWGDVTSSTSYVRHSLTSRFDATGQFAVLGANPDLSRPLDERDLITTILHETHLSSSEGARVPWFLGIFYADGHVARNTALRNGASGDAYSERRFDDIDELAIFGGVIWRLTPTLSLSTGLRLFHSSLTTNADVAEPLLNAESSFSGEIEDSGAAPDIRFSFQPSRRTLLFLSAAEGYRNGGFNSGAALEGVAPAGQPFRTYNGDEIWTYEAGARLSLFENRLGLQLVAFENEWRSLQTDALIANGFVATGNVGDARAYGLELDVRYIVDDNWTIEAHAFLNEPELTHVSPSYPNAAPGRLPGSPESSASFSLRYEDSFAFSGETPTWFAQANVTYSGGATTGFSQGASIGNYVALDARAGISLHDWQATLFADNLTSADEGTFSAGNPYQSGRVYETPLRPLTVGLSLHRTFGR